MSKPKVLITGAKGFVGKNLVARLEADGYGVLPFDVDTDPNLLYGYCAECGFVFHLAGVNRPQNPAEFMEGNFDFTARLVDSLKRVGKAVTVAVSSSIQAEKDNEYGKSKKAGEEVVLNYGKATGAKVYIYRLPNVFGKWCRPNYNSAVATFCHNIVRGLPIRIDNREAEVTLVYIDDVIDEFLKALQGKVKTKKGFAEVDKVYRTTVGYLADTIGSFAQSRRNLFLPLQTFGSLEKKLYATYTSYLPKDGFKYTLQSHTDNRGSFTEFVKTAEYGQVSINISKSGITKGNHWHHTKNEKFLVVSGRGVIRFRKVDEEEIIECYVSGDKLEAVDIPCGYTHNIENLGDSDMITVMWASEVFDKDNPDTVYLEV